MASPALSLRPAAEEDLDELVEVFESAFTGSILNHHCFPPSDPESHENNVSLAKNGLPDIIVAYDPDTKRILGWARWVRREEPLPHTVITLDRFPASGDRDLARRFFQANVDVTGKIVGGRPHWFLSLLVVRREESGKGVGSALMHYGTGRADGEGWMCYVNSSLDGRRLYEKFGFETVEVSEFEHGIATWHMKREPQKIDSTHSCSI